MILMSFKLSRLVFIFFFLSSITSIFAETNSFTGIWKTIDDKTGKEKSLVEVWEDENGNLHGKIIKLYRGPEEDQNPLCDKCDGDKKDTPMIGMEILWDFTQDNKKSPEVWNSGKILDPKTGVTYSCNLKLDESSSQLNVRGFVGFSLIGRTQTWLRESEE